MNLKIVNKTKFYRSILIILTVLSFIFLCFFNKSSSEGIENFKTITIKDGDTLWSIAEYEKKENPVYKNSDVRDIVYNIKKINNLKSSALEINQSLIIPTN